MRTHGRITNVYFEQFGSGVYSETPAGATSLFVDSSADFDEEGGLCVIEDQQYAYTLGAEAEEKDELILSPPLGVDVLEGTAVATFPVTQVKMATVAVSDDDALDGEDMVCQIHHSLTAMLNEGIREHRLGETVEVSDEPDGILRVTNVLGEEGQVIASTLVGENPDDPMSDNLPPETAPVVTAAPLGVNAVQVKWTRVPNHDPVSYRVYASLASPVALTGDNLLGVTPGDSYTLSRLSDGTPVPFDVDVFFRVVPFDVDGDGPGSNEASTRPRKADNETISVEYAYLGKVEAEQINAGEMFSDFVESDKIQTGSTHPRVVLDNTGILATDALGDPRFVLPTDPNSPAEFRGVGEFDAVTVKDRLSLRGKDNEFARSSRVRLSHAVSRPPQGPSVSVVYPSTVIPGDPTFAQQGYKKFSDGKWYGFVNIWGGDFQVVQRDELPDGSLGPGTIIVSDGISKYPGRRMTALDVIEHQGRLMVVCTDSGVQDAWWTNTMVIRQYDLSTGAILRTNILYSIILSQRKRALAVVGSSVFMMSVDEAGGWYLEALEAISTSASTPVNTSLVWKANTGYDEDITSLQQVPGSSLVPGATGTRWALQRSGHPCVFVLNGSGVRQVNDEFQAPNGTGTRKSVWWDGATWYAQNMAQFYRLSDYKWSGSYMSTQLWAAKFSWFDSNSGGTGQHESLASPEQNFAMRKFAHVQIASPPIPAVDETQPLDSVTGPRFYFRLGTTGDFRRGSTDLPNGVVSVVYRTVDNTGPVADSGTIPPFPLSTPAEIYSENTDTQGPIVIFRGDGSGRMGPYSWDKDAHIPGLAARNSGQPALVSGATTVITYDTVITSTGGMQLLNGTIVVPKAGWYDVSGCVTFASSTSGARRIVLLGVGNSPGSFTTYYNANTVGAPANPASFSTLPVAAKVYLQAGQCVGIAASALANWVLDVSQPYMCNLQAVYVGA